MKPNEQLEQLAKLYIDKNKQYGDAYLTAGKIFHTLFPEGLNISTEKEFNRFAIFNHIINKVIRYSANWDYGHDDSLLDLAIYATMLLEIDGLNEK
jgi:hypothetical protein